MRSVWGCMPVSSAATEITYTARSEFSGICSAMSVLHFHTRRLVADLGQRFDGGALLICQLGGYHDLELDQQVARLARVPTIAGRDTPAAHPKDLAGLGPWRHLQ